MDLIQNESHIEERLDSSESTVLILPEIAEEEKTFTGKAQELFSLVALEKNWALLEPIINAVDPNDFEDVQTKEEFILKRDLVYTLLRRNRSLLSVMATAPSTNSTVHNFLPEAQRIVSETPIDQSELQRVLEQKFRHAQGKIVVVSPSHVSTYSEVKAAITIAKDSNVFPDDGKTGILVFDEHTDWYHTSMSGVPKVSRDKKPDFSSPDDEVNARAYGWYLQGQMYDPLPVRKSNVFMHLAEEGLIDMCCVVGPSAGSVTITTTPSKRDATYKYFVDRQDTFSVLGFAPHVDSRTGAINRESYMNEIKRKIQEMRERGITNILISLDLDVLRSELGYTGFDYNTYAIVFNLGIQDIEEQVEAYNAEIETYDRNAAAVKTLEFIDSVLFITKNPISSGEKFGNVKPKLPGGLPAGFIGQAIDEIKKFAEEEGIVIGIPLPHGIFVGDVVELSGKDVGENTTKVAAAFARRIAK
jgi:hypothetical protein